MKMFYNILNKYIGTNEHVAVLIFLLCLILSIQTACALELKARVDAKERKAVIETISKLVIENYVFADVGEKSTDYIQAQHKAGEYDQITDPEAFAQKLSTDLQSVSHDKHMRIRVRETEIDKVPDAANVLS